jgi:hypothetical protein
MDEPFRQFQWHVSPTYEWQDWLDGRGHRVLIPTTGLLGLSSPTAVEHTWQSLAKRKRQTGPVLGPTIDAGPARFYNPMSREHASLFRLFADLDYENPDAILAFASQYGLLGLEIQEQAKSIRKKDGEFRHHFVRGESHLAWAREICLMRDALQLVRARTPQEEEEHRAAWARVNLKPPYEDDRARCTWLFNVHLQRVQARMSFQPDSLPKLLFSPLNLLAAMWLQLALSVVGSKEFRACKHCRRLFEISTEETGYRSHREFCSESCKTKDYRRRKRTALKMAKDGAEPRKIADAIATELATVRGWISAGKRRGGRA